MNRLKIVIFVAVVLFFACNKKEKREVSDDKILCAEDFIEEFDSIDTIVVLEDAIRRGEGPFNVMERLNVDKKIRSKILFTLADETDFTTLKVGERFAAVYNLDTTRILEFIYFENKITTHKIKISYENDSVGFVYVLDKKPSEVRRKLIKGTLESPTLDAQLRKTGLSPQIAQAAANVLECKIPFSSAARIGDEFELLIEETIYNDTITKDSVVERTLDDKTALLFVSYHGSRAGTCKGYRYFDGDKSSYNAHYTEDGEALIFSGLRYPLDKTHITSPYGNRIHPVTGKNTTHTGVDYRASVGTPVYAVAEGKVVESKFDDYSGNFIAIKHKDNTTSYYLHLNKRSVSVGANVKGRQIIGYSGNTGQSNGPHLHFGIKQANGAWMNPLKKRMIATPKLSGEKLEKLKSQIEEIKRIYAELSGG